MRHVIVFLLILMTVSLKSQDVDSTKRDISLIILAKKERPMRNIFVRTLNNTEVGITNRKGLFVFENVSDYDTISMMLPRIGETLIPVALMDSIVVKLQLARRFYYANNEVHRETFNEKSNNFNKIKTEPTNLIDVQERIKKEPNLSINDLLQEVSGLTFAPPDGSPGSTITANLRGPTSIIRTANNNQPMVVLDGQMIGTLAEADSKINIYDIKTIEVQKNATQWGTFGANGVIVIKTR